MVGFVGGRRKQLTYSLGNSPIANTHNRLVYEWRAGRQRRARARKAGGVLTFPQAPSPTITSFLRIWTNASDACPYTRWKTRAGGTGRVRWLTGAFVGGICGGGGRSEGIEGE